MRESNSYLQYVVVSVTVQSLQTDILRNCLSHQKRSSKQSYRKEGYKYIKICSWDVSKNRIMSTRFISLHINYHMLIVLP